MFALVLAAGLVVGAAGGSTAAQPQASGPLREIVYKFSDNETTEYTTDQAPGNQDSSSGTVSSTGTGLAAPPESSTKTTGFSGTMTVDVLQVDSSGYLKAEVKEMTDAENGKKPFDAVFIVRPDGQLVRASGSDDPDMDDLMQYLGTSYFAGRVLQQGEQWTSTSVFDKTEYDTTTSVTGVNGDDVMLKAEMKAHGAMSTSNTVDTSIVYNAAKLVPVALDVLRIQQGSGDTSNAEETFHYHFDRVSDTLDPT